MKKNNIIVSCILLFVVLGLFTGCVTSTRVKFDANVEGAEVYINGDYIGQTPVEIKMTNSSFYEPEVVMKKEGYEDMHMAIQKETKLGNCISGYFFLFPLLWCYGPKSYQYYNLYKKR